jgi:Bacterial protein of unknown function (DUF898)
MIRHITVHASGEIIMTEPQHGSSPIDPSGYGQQVHHPYASSIQQPGPIQPQARAIQPVYFDGGAGSYVGISILGFLITVFSLGLLFPLAYVLRLRWRIEHTVIEGRRLRFNGTGLGLFGMWLKWWFFILITFGIYSFWVRPRLERWSCDHTVLTPPVR